MSLFPSIRGPGIRAVVLFAVMALTSAPLRAEVTELRITRQPGLIYMPMILVEHRNLIDKHAKALGLPGLKVSFVTMTSGGAGNDALLSGNVDLVMTGATPLMVISDRTKRDVLGVAGVGGAPMFLLTRNPKVKTLKDFGPGDKIALPTIKISSQAVVLQIAAKRQLGKATALDEYTVQLGHPDAVAGISNPSSELNGHFSLPPYEQQELKIPGVHLVLNSYELVGDYLSNAVIYARKDFCAENPKAIKALLAALEEANESIKKDPRAALETYKTVTGEKASVEELLEILKMPGVFFSTAPKAIMLQAQHLYDEGVLKIKPNAWTDYFISEVHGLPGN